VRRDCLESWPTRTGISLLMMCLSLGWCRGVRVWCVPFTLVRGVSLCLITSTDVVINDVTLMSLKMPEWSQLVFCDDFVLVTMVASHLFIGDCRCGIWSRH
jgi:hypothetical protein